MWRVCLGGVAFTNASTGFARTPHRWLWTCEQTLRATNSIDAFLDELKRGVARDPQWVLDYSAIEELSGRLVCSGRVPSDKFNPLESIHNALCLTAKHIDLRHIHMVLSSPQNLRWAAALVREASLHTKIESIEMHIHGSALNERVLNSDDMEDHEGGVNGVANLFQALANLEGTHNPLQRLSIVMIDHATGSPALWHEGLVLALSSLLLQVQLTHVSFSYMGLQSCSESCLKDLAKALSNSNTTLRSLEIKAVPLLVMQILKGGVLRHCKALQRLDLSYNHLGDVWNVQLAKELSEGVGGWHRLHQLTLAQCEVSAYSLEFFARVLPSCKSEGEEEEKRKGKGKQKVEEAFGSIACIEELNLASNKLTDDAIFHLSTCLVQCRLLKQLDLRHNSISKCGAEQLLSSLTHAPRLRCLRLRSNRLTDEGIRSLPACIKRWQGLEEIDLTRCRLTARSLGDLAAAISSLPQLRVLRVSGNDWRPLESSRAPLSPPPPDREEANPLQLFAHNRSYMQPSSDAADGPRIHDDWKVPTSYELDRRDRETGRVRYRAPHELEQEMNKTQPGRGVVDSFQAFGAALRGCGRLRVLDLSDCSLQDEGFAWIAPGVGLPPLEELYLNANPLFAKGGPSLEGLTRALWGVTATLRMLDLSFLGLGDLGVSALCDGPLREGGEGELGVLGQLKKLEVLRLSYVNTGPLGIEAVRETAAELPQLKALFLDGNKCSGQDLVELLSSLCFLRQLRFVALTGCVLGPRDREQVLLSKEFACLRDAGVKVVI